MAEIRRKNQGQKSGKGKSFTQAEQQLISTKRCSSSVGLSFFEETALASPSASLDLNIRAELSRKTDDEEARIDPQDVRSHDAVETVGGLSDLMLSPHVSDNVDREHASFQARDIDAVEPKQETEQKKIMKKSHVKSDFTMNVPFITATKCATIAATKKVSSLTCKKSETTKKEDHGLEVTREHRGESYQSVSFEMKYSSAMPNSNKMYKTANHRAETEGTLLLSSDASAVYYSRKTPESQRQSHLSAITTNSSDKTGLGQCLHRKSNPVDFAVSSDTSANRGSSRHEDSFIEYDSNKGLSSNSTSFPKREIDEIIDSMNDSSPLEYGSTDFPNLDLNQKVRSSDSFCNIAALFTTKGLSSQSSDTASLQQCLKFASPSGFSALSMESAGHVGNHNQNMQCPLSSLTTDSARSQEHPAEGLTFDEASQAAIKLGSPKSPDVNVRLSRSASYSKSPSIDIRSFLSRSNRMPHLRFRHGLSPIQFPKSRSEVQEETSLLMQPLFASPMNSTIQYPGSAVSNKLRFSPREFFRNSHNDHDDVKRTFCKKSPKPEMDLLSFALTSPVTRRTSQSSLTRKQYKHLEPPPLIPGASNRVAFCEGISLENEATFSFEIDSNSKLGGTTMKDASRGRAPRRKRQELPTHSDKRIGPNAIVKRRTMNWNGIADKGTLKEDDKKYPINKNHQHSFHEHYQRADSIVESIKNSFGTRTAEALGWCKCKNSRCLKLYCDCFRNGSYCGSECNCKKCQNTAECNGPGGVRSDTVEKILARRPDAFNIRVTKIGEGCSCKKNKCLKKYCACYADRLLCIQGKCKCCSCENFATSEGINSRRSSLEELHDIKAEDDDQASVPPPYGYVDHLNPDNEKGSTSQEMFVKSDMSSPQIDVGMESPITSPMPHLKAPSTPCLDDCYDFESAEV